MKSFSYFRKLYVSALLLALVIVTGTVGYMALDHSYSFLDALYMT